MNEVNEILSNINAAVYGGHRKVAENISADDMSLRDYFAGNALSGFCTNSWIINTALEASEHPNTVSPELIVARLAFFYADAMMKARRETE